MSSDVVLNVGAVIDPSVPAAQAALDDTIRKAREARRELMTSINTVFMSLNYMVSAVRIGVRMIGATLDPVQNAALTMIQGAVSAALAIAGMFTATTILAGVGMALMLVTAEMSFISSAKVLAEIAAAREDITEAERNLSAVQWTMGAGL